MTIGRYFLTKGILRARTVQPTVIQKTIQQKNIKRFFERKEKSEDLELSSTFDALNIRDEKAAIKFVDRLHPDERKLLYDIISRKRANQYQTTKQQEEELSKEVPPEELTNLWWMSYTPFFFYGFIDNSVMIFAGESFDIFLGHHLGVSIMAGAATGNIVSNLIGLGLLHYVELGVATVVQQPQLKSSQYHLWAVQFVQSLGRVCGILSGCVLGMFPLLFYTNERQEQEVFHDNISLEKKENDFNHDWLTTCGHTLNRDLYNEYKQYEQGVQVIADTTTADESSIFGRSRTAVEESEDSSVDGDKNDEEPLPGFKLEY